MASTKSRAAPIAQQPSLRPRPSTLPREQATKAQGTQKPPVKPVAPATASTTSAAGATTPNPLDELATSQSGWKTAAEIGLPIVGWGVLAGLLVLSMKSVMNTKDPPDWKEAKAKLVALGFEGAENFEDDRLLFVLFRDLIWSCHPTSHNSINYCGYAFETLESLLKLESTLRLDARVQPQSSDSDRAEELAKLAVYYIEQVQHGPGQKQYEMYERAKSRLTDAIIRHMFAVQCLVAKG